MDNMIVVTKSQPSVEQVRDLAVDFGFAWFEDTGSGMLEKDNARIYVTYIKDVLSEYSDGELELIVPHILGRKPSVAVDIHYRGVLQGVADDVAAKMVAVWGGFVDDNDTLYEELARKYGTPPG